MSFVHDNEPWLVVTVWCVVVSLRA